MRSVSHLVLPRSAAGASGCDGRRRTSRPGGGRTAAGGTRAVRGSAPPGRRQRSRTHGGLATYAFV